MKRRRIYHPRGLGDLRTETWHHPTGHGGFSQLPGELVARRGYSDNDNASSNYVGVGDDTSSLISGITGTISSVVNTAAAGQANAAAQANLLAQQQAQTNAILPIIVIGGLVLVFMMMKKKKPAAAAAPAATTNPSRRRRRRRRNPTTFTKKGERMYRHIRDSYGGDPRAKEIAARTVYARARRTKGLVRTS